MKSPNGLWFALTLVFLGSPLPLGAQTPKPSPKIDLNGDWIDGARRITITVAGKTVTAVYKEDYVCDPQDGSPKQTTKDDFAGQINGYYPTPGTELTGQTTACSWGSGNPCGRGLTKVNFKLTVSADGQSLQGSYYNCNMKKDVPMTVTRECKSANAKLCAAIVHSIATIAKIIPPPVNMRPSVSFDPIKWQRTLAQYQPALAANLDALRQQYCDDATKKSIDGMKATLNALKPGTAHTEAQVRAEMLKVSSIDFDLKNLAVQSCAATGPPAPPSPPASGICPEGTAAKKPGDDDAIDRIRKQIGDSIKEAEKMLEEYEREHTGGASTTAGQYADYWRTRLGQLKRLKGYWDNIRAASCVPPEIPQLIRAMLAGRTDVCINLCYATAEWIEKMYPGPQGEYQRKLFLEACGFSCPE